MKRKKTTFVNTKLTLSITVFKQENAYIAYIPSLDLSSHGRSPAKARKNLEGAIEILFEELTEAGTLKEVLKELGWRHSRSTWQPPKLVKQELVVLPVRATASGIWVQ